MASPGIEPGLLPRQGGVLTTGLRGLLSVRHLKIFKYNDL